MRDLTGCGSRSQGRTRPGEREEGQGHRSTADCDEGIPGPGAFGVVDGLLKALIGRLDMTAVEDVGLNAVSGHLVGPPLRGVPVAMRPGSVTTRTRLAPVRLRS